MASTPFEIQQVDAVRFLDEIFGELPDSEIVCAAKQISMESKGFLQTNARKGRFHRWAKSRGADGGCWYFCVSTVKPPEGRKAKVQRRKKDCRAACCVVLDDVGTKADPAKIPLEPSWKLETSPGNWQWGYILAEPTDDWELFTGFLKVLAQRELTDSRGVDIAHVFRVPDSENIKVYSEKDEEEGHGKAGKLVNPAADGNGGFRARLAHWDPERAWTLPELMAAFGVTEEEARAIGDVPRKRASLALPEGVEIEDPALKWMYEQGWVLEDRGEWVDIQCPWEGPNEETGGHTPGTGGQTSTSYSPLGRGHSPHTRSFSCQHDHCSKINTARFLELVATEGGPEVPVSNAMAVVGKLLPKDMDDRGDVLKALGGLLGAMMPAADDGDDDDPDPNAPDPGLPPRRPEGESQMDHLQKACKSRLGKKNMVARMNEIFAQVTIGGKEAVVDLESLWERDLIVRSVKGFTEYCAPLPSWPALTPAGRPTKRGTAVTWLGSRGHRQHRRMVFEPEAAYDADTLNTWVGFDLEPAEGAWPTIEAYLREVVAQGDPEIFEYLMEWGGHLVQHPGDLPHAAIVLRGKGGVGKTTFYELFAAIVGKRHSYLETSSQTGGGQFNKHHAGKILIGMDEAFFAGDKRAVGRLNSLITSSTLDIEAKGYDAINLSNYARVIITSEGVWVIPAPQGARRFLVVEVREVWPRGDPRWAVLKDLEERGRDELRAFAWALATRELKRHPRNPPRTAALDNQEREHMLRGGGDEREAWWLTCLEEGVLPGEKKVAESWGAAGEKLLAEGFTGWPEGWGIVPRQDLAKSFLETGRNDRRFTSDRAAETSFGMWFAKEVAPSARQRLPKEADGARPHYYKVPPLAECRRAFNPHRIDWPEPDADYQTGLRVVPGGKLPDAIANALGKEQNEEDEK